MVKHGPNADDLNLPIVSGASAHQPALLTVTARPLISFRVVSTGPAPFLLSVIPSGVTLVYLLEL